MTSIHCNSIPAGHRALVAFTLMYVGATAQGADSSTARVLADSASVMLNPVMVTADKLEQNQQDVSGSISVFDGQTLDDHGLTTLEELADQTPNVGFYRADSHTTYLVYRGVGGTTNMNKVWNVNLDGVTQPYVATNTLLDVERVEVLRGGQGALYGRNTHAGVVNVVTRDPGEHFEADANLAYERFGTRKFQGAFGGPLGEQIGYRVAFGYQKSDGFFKNDFLGTDDGNDHEQFSGRAKLVLTPGERDRVTLVLTADRFDGGFDSYSTTGTTTTSNNEPGYNDGYLLSPTLTWQHEFDNFTLTSITGYARSNYGFLQDWDFSQMDVSTGEYDEVYDTFSQELRLAGSAGPRLDWQLGVFLMAEDLETWTLMRTGRDAAAWGLPAGIFQRQDSRIETRAAALFGQATYRPHARIELTGRLRLDYERKSLDWRGTSAFSPAVAKSFEQDWFAALPSVSLAWLLDDDRRLYASLSTGFKAGDYNNVQLDPAVVTEAVDPEHTTTWEIGYKGLFAQKRLELNGALFYIDWRDLQVETPVNKGGALVYLKQNAAEAHSFGVELEARARLGQRWDAFAGAGYLFEYKFDRFPDSTSGDLTGKHLPNANRFSLSAGATYRHPSGLFATADVALNGRKFFDESNRFAQDRYTLLNARVGYETAHGALYLYARNLLDENYAVSMFSGATLFGEPRVVGVQARLFF